MGESLCPMGTPEDPGEVGEEGIHVAQAEGDSVRGRVTLGRRTAVVRFCCNKQIQFCCTTRKKKNVRTLKMTFANLTYSSEESGLFYEAIFTQTVIIPVINCFPAMS